VDKLLKNKNLTKYFLKYKITLLCIKQKQRKEKEFMVFYPERKLRAAKGFC
jgi:hypothetical protein